MNTVSKLRLSVWYYISIHVIRWRHGRSEGVNSMQFSVDDIVVVVSVRLVVA